MQHIIVNCVKFFKSPLNYLWQIVYKSRELSLALFLFELIKGVVLELLCCKVQIHRVTGILLRGAVLEQLHIVKVHWSCPLALSLLLSSLKELSLSNCILLKSIGVVLWHHCAKSRDYLWQNRVAILSRKPRTQTHIYYIVGC